MPAYDAILAAPPCKLGAVFSGQTLVRLDFLPAGTRARSADPRARRLERTLEAYWSNPHAHPAYPAEPGGTAFQQRVWGALCAIPCGQTRTYGALAGELGSAPRAVGQACGANPLPILIPCHRVVAARGLGGFMHAADGMPLTVKRWLLDHESTGTG